MKNRILAGIEWFRLERPGDSEEHLCKSRDVFEGRLNRMLSEFSSQNVSIVAVSLFTAVIGELGNNSFDHNLGRWRDIPGCRFEYGTETGVIWAVLADRGQGVTSSLKQVKPDLTSDEEALEMAFHQRISGRSPEKRGNGLKFVRRVINGNPERGLFFVSGNATRVFGGLSERMPKEGDAAGKGTLAVVCFKSALTK